MAKLMLLPMCRMLVALLLMSAAAMPAISAIHDKRSIQVKGVFILVDEAALLHRIKTISEQNPGRQEFIEHVYQMLNHEPYIAASSVRYSWPNDVIIEIREISPVAVLNQSEYLSRDCGRVPKAEGMAHIKLINVNTENKSLDENGCLHIVSLLPELTTMPIEEVRVLGNGDYVLTIANRHLVVSTDIFTKSISRVKKVAHRIYTGSIDADFVDMRYTSGMALRKGDAL